nr:LAGLIDADG endonuclease [Ophiocordyceps lanpingensis]
MVPVFILYLLSQSSIFALSIKNLRYLSLKNSINIVSTQYENKNKDNMLSYYLSGLVEGDGHLSVPKVLKGPSGKSKVANIEVIFALKDLPSAEYLLKKYGGNIYKHSVKKIVKWKIQDKKSVTLIVNTINGKFRTPKINALHNMIDFLNNKGENIKKLPLDSSSLESNAWLAGFIDSDGCFSIKGFSSEKVRTYLAFQFYLAQRVNDISGESLEKLMNSLAEFLNTKLTTRIFKEKYSQFVVNTSSITSNKILINYLNTYPLLSSKHLDYKDWEKALNLYEKKLHRNPIYLEKIRTLKFNMNNGRSLFNWSHLENTIYKS